MKKTIFAIIFLTVFLFFGIRIFAESATKCANGFEYITHKINDTTNEKLCYNKQIGLSYHIKKSGSNKGEYDFYKDWWYCGTNCDFDGKNCKEGFCHASRCNQKEGYTQMKYISLEGFVCYNPDTKMSYRGPFTNGKYRYFINGKKCGENCDFNGINCKIGYCNPSYCDAQKGYTQIKELEKSYGCYNPKTHLSYTFGKHSAKKDFYIDDEYCGGDCDLDGKNCSYNNACSVSECAENNGYTEIIDSKCYNPTTHISYSGNKFYLNNVLCGYNCDINGKNCKTGACYADECNRKYGYPEIKNNRCYNPKTFLSLDHYLGKRFYYKSVVCGRNCDLDGKNCEAINGIKGICNIDDCPKGYKQIANGDTFEVRGVGMCKKENSDKLLLLDKNNKFQDYNIYRAKEKAKFGAGVVISPIILLTHPYD